MSRFPKLTHILADRCSNTKIRDYLKAIYSSPVCASIIRSIPAPNAVTKLESMDRDKTCQLSFAGDMVLMLVNGLLERPEVQNVEGAVEKASLNVCGFQPVRNSQLIHVREAYGLCQPLARALRPLDYLCVPVPNP